MNSIYFNEQEMMDFLNKRGWDIQEKEFEESQHLHGSMFMFHQRREWKATKDGNTYALKEAFTKEIKLKLLHE